MMCSGGRVRIDVLVNNAGILSRSNAADCTDAEWDTVIATNVTAVFQLCRAVVPVMRRQFTADGRSGAIVNIASDWAVVGAHNAVAYGASKGAIAQLTRSMAVDHAKDGIRVNAVCPGDTETDMLLSGRGDEKREDVSGPSGSDHSAAPRRRTGRCRGGRGVHGVGRGELRDGHIAAGRWRQYRVVIANEGGRTRMAAAVRPGRATRNAGLA